MKTGGRPIGPRIPRAQHTLDVVAIVALIPLLFLPLLLVGLLVLLDSPGSILYRARRVGLGGQPFTMLKFRTMRSGSSGDPVAPHDDARITPIGRFLRRSRLDELPQLWNVLRGEMRLVGPRPEDESFVAAFSSEYAEILSIAPGLTGPTQVEFAATEAHMLASDQQPVHHYLENVMPVKVALDLEYVRGRSRLGDLVVLWRTLLLPFTLAATRLRGFVEHHRPHAYTYAVSAAAGAVLLLVFLVASGPPR